MKTRKTTHSVWRAPFGRNNNQLRYLCHIKNISVWLHSIEIKYTTGFGGLEVELKIYGHNEEVPSEGYKPLPIATALVGEFAEKIEQFRESIDAGSHEDLSGSSIHCLVPLRGIPFEQQAISIVAALSHVLGSNNKPWMIWHEVNWTTEVRFGKVWVPFAEHQLHIAGVISEEELLQSAR